ncbi:MAG: FtsW/RodA/SpoVE family cell cycle protein [Candidatus Pacebacteria bacterium]|nr:FtsW/RodA/SpoVE family cell cycle protein [Candidatus Paceibacterota bacterium]
MRGVGNKIDRPLLIITGMLVVSGFFLFSSASLGLLAREGVHFSSLVFSQLVLGIGFGTISLFLISRIHYRFLKQYSLYLFILSAILTLLVFIPFIGFSSGGATRWIFLGPLSIQPAEILKIGTILYLATYLSNMRAHLDKFKTGIIAFVLILAVPAVILLLQPDTSTLVVIAAAAVGMFFVAGARWRDIGILILIGIIALGSLIAVRPYVLDRITTFINPAADQLGSGYQIKQSLIAVGSGKIAGRGFGQSVQKFGYLPEPTGDSVFAVAAEEFGFLGAVAILALFVALVIRSFWVAVRAPDYFGGIVVVGLTLLIVTQALINIASMLGVIPLTGLPLPFISHGGTAMLVTLASMGVILNVSKYAK